jgi:hypothetical protein
VFYIFLVAALSIKLLVVMTLLVGNSINNGILIFSVVTVYEFDIIV